MRHLTEGELLDLAEGRPLSDSADHLASCEACRRQLSELRSAMIVAAAVDVPEPSPLFWEHLSARVREAIEAEGRPAGAGGPGRWFSARAIVPIGALAVVVLAAVVVLGPRSDSNTAGNRVAGSAVGGVGAIDTRELPPLVDDPSFTLLADLTSDLDWDAATEAGFAPRAGAVDDVVTSLEGGERLELERLLQDVLKPPGA